jgi:hypothetical protein
MRISAHKQNQRQQKSSTNLTRSKSSAPGARHETHALRLQRTLGNRAALRLLQTKVDSLNTETGSTGKDQAKLAVNTPGDSYEQEADQIAEQVMRMPESHLQRSCDCGVGCSKCQTEQVNKKHEQLQTKRVGTSDSGQMAAPPRVHEVLASPGRQLDASARAFFEPRFGHDFSGVRVHSGANAEQSAREVNASAYTVGQNIVFGAGRFAPETREGRRLIAHELAHVLQQNSASAVGALQRDDPKNAPKNPPAVVPQDVAVLMSPDPDFVTLTAVIAPGAKVLRVTSIEDLVKQLKLIKGPIRTLYFVAHMTEEGDLMFTAPGSKPGDEIMTYVPAEKMATEIKGTAQVENLDFQGCSIAQAPAEMNRIRTALKATKATGSTCTLVTQASDPVKIDGGKAITKPEQLKDEKAKATFRRQLKEVREKFLDDKKKCIVNDTEAGYFQTGGKLLALWVNPDSMADSTGFDNKKSICYKNLKVEKIDPTKKFPVIGPDDCKLVELVKKKP